MSEQQAQQILYQIQALEQYLIDLSQKESTLFGILREAGAVIETIRAAGNDSKSETLVPVGMGAYLKANLIDTEKLLLSVGAGAVMEKGRDSALNYLESRIKEVEIALRETSGQKQEVANALEQGKLELNRLAQAARSQKK